MSSQQNKITDRKYLVPFVLITLLFFLWGFARAILDVLNKHFQNALHIISENRIILNKFFPRNIMLRHTNKL